MRNALTVIVLALCLPSFGQRFVEEVPNIAALQARNVHNINSSVHVRGYYVEGDGGGGDFVITNSATGTDNGLKILSTQNISYSYIRHVSGGVNPKWYGANGNGTSNDTVRLQEAITEGTAKGYSLDLGVANYLITSPLTVPNNLMLFGAGDKSIITGVSAANIFQFNSVTNVVMRDFKVAGTSGVSFLATNSSKLYFQRINQSGAIAPLAGYTAGFEFEGGGDVTLDNVGCFGNGQNTQISNLDYNILSGFFNTTTTNIVILNPTIKNSYSKLGIALFNSINPKIRDGFIDMNLQGTTNNADGYGIAIYGKTGVAEVYRASVIGVTLTNLYGSGILFRNIQDGEIVGCQIVKSSQLTSDFALGQGAITITKGQRNRVVNNGIYDSGINSGIEFDSTTNLICSGNSISLPGTNRWGIEIRGLNFGANINGNTVENGHRGIGTTIGNGVADTFNISGNTIRNIVDGIFLSGDSSNNIVRANQVYNNSGTGITDLGSYDTFNGNYVLGGPLGGLLGLSAAGTNGILSLNVIAGQATGFDISGSGYRYDPNNQCYNNAIPITDTGGALVKILTSGTFPSVRDSRAYQFNYSTPTSVTNFADGLPGDKRTFTSANTNVTLIHSTQLTLDGAGDFNLQPGDVLTVERDNTGAWRQTGKSIDSSWMYMDRAAGNLIINARLFNRSPVSISPPPSTNTYALDVQNPTNTPNTLIFRAGTVTYPNGIALLTDATGTNFFFQFNGVSYKKSFIQGAAGTVEVNDGTGNLLWRPISSLYNFNSDFVVTGGTNVSLATPVPIARGGTGTNSFGTQVGVVPFLTASTNLLGGTADLQWIIGNEFLQVQHPTTTIQPLFKAINADTVSSLSLYADRVYGTGGTLDLAIERTSGGGIVFTNGSARSLKLTEDWSTLVGNGSTNVARTNSFLYIPTTHGPPSGTPNPQSGWCALTFDDVNTNLYIYQTGWNKIRLQ